MKKESFWEHLEELRRRLIYGIVAIAVFSILGYVFSGYVIDHFGKITQGLYFFSPAEGFFSRIKIAFYIGILLGIPFLIWQLYLFVSPGLLKNERKIARLLLLLSLPFFFGGIAFSTFVVLPIGIRFLLKFGSDTMVPMINVSQLISFVFWTSIGIGIIFQLPVIVFILTKMGFINYKFLKKKRRISYVLIFAIIAFITPSVDAISLLLIALPIVFLYEFSIFISYIFRKRDG